MVGSLGHAEYVFEDSVAIQGEVPTVLSWPPLPTPSSEEPQEAGSEPHPGVYTAQPGRFAVWWESWPH